MPQTASVKGKSSGTIKKPVVEHPGPEKKISSNHTTATQEKKLPSLSYPEEEEPPKKTASKLAKKAPRSEKVTTGAKRVNSVVVDKVPKKNAQRTKGSISLGKTLKNGEADALAKKRPPSASADRICRPLTRERVGRVESLSKTKAQEKTARLRSATRKEEDTSEKEQEPWVTVVQQGSSEALDGEKQGPSERPESKGGDLSRVGDLPTSSCSFFEKIQQGVKAYFSSRGSFEDKNKKKVAEGGIENRGGVGTGAKEEPKKRNPNYDHYGTIFNRITRSESGCSYGYRLNSGGQSTNSFTSRPTLFRKLKRKKLYRPKRHYVRIQIPRKGYFYRSTVQLKNPSSSSLPEHRVEAAVRVESVVEQHEKSKIQIPRVAPAGAECSHIFKKRMTRNNLTKKAKILDSSHFQDLLETVRVHKGIPFSPEYLDRLVSLLLKAKTNSEDMESDSLHTAEEIVSEDVSSVKEERPTTANSDDLTMQKCRKKSALVCVSERDELQARANGLSGISEGNKDVYDKESGLNFLQIPLTHRSSLDTVLNCLNSVLDKKDYTCDLEIFPARRPSKEVIPPQVVEEFHMLFEPLTFSEATLDCIAEESIPTTPDVSESHSPPTDSWQTGFAMTGNNCSSDRKLLFWIGSEDNLSASLMNDIDLHLELQNYLTAVDKFGSTNNPWDNNFERPRMFGCNSELIIPKDKDVQPSPSFLSSKGSSNPKGDSNTLPPFPERRNHPKTASDEPKEALVSFAHASVKCEGKGDDMRKLLESPQNLQKNPSVAVRSVLHPMEDNTHHQIDGYDKVLPFNQPPQKKQKSKAIAQAIINDNHSKHLLNSRSLISKKTRTTSKSGGDSSKTPLKTVSGHSPTPKTPKKAQKQRWSPTLQELIAVYKIVLKESQNSKLNSKNSFKSCISTQFHSFLNSKLRERKYKSELLKMYGKISPVKIASGWKKIDIMRTPDKRETPELEKYVNVFQEILSSSLSISQISWINDIMADLQMYMDSQKRKSDENIPKTLNEATIKEREAQTCVKDPKAVKKKTANPRKVNKRKEPEEVLRMNLSSPTALESILQSGLNESDGVDNPHSKFLVSVNLCGDEILVNRVSSFKNEKNLKRKKVIHQKETSDLIIENVAWKSNKKKSVTRIKESAAKKKSAPKIVKRAPKQTKKCMKEVAPLKVPPPSPVDLPPPSLELEKQNSIVKFEYDQQLLKVQHPIEAIIESSESKIYELADTTPEDTQRKIEKSEVDISLKEDSEYSEILIDALEDSNFLFSKELSQFNTSFWESEEEKRKYLEWMPESYAFLKPREENKCKEKEVVANPQDDGTEQKEKTPLKDDVSVCQNSINISCARKTRKILPSRSLYFSYPLIKIQDEGKTPKDMKKPSLTSRNFKKPEIVSKNSSKQLVLRKKSDPKPQSQAPVKTSSRESANTILFVNNEASSDCCSAELLVNNKPKCQSLNMVSKPSCSDVWNNKEMDKRETSLSEDNTPECCSGTSTTTVGMLKISPIVLQPPKDCDEASFPALMIQSDSILMSNSSFTLARDKIKSFFKSNSDTQFYSGKADSQEDGKPFVTFVLTPKQKETAGVPSKQVQTVEKAGAVEKQEEEQENPEPAKKEELDKEPSLKSIEEFIKVLTKKRLSRAKSSQQPANKSVGKRSKPSWTKNFIPCQRAQILQSVERKVHHQCHPRKQLGKKLKSESKKEEKEQKTVTTSNEASVETFSKFIKNLSNALTDIRKEGDISKSNEKEVKHENIQTECSFSRTEEEEEKDKILQLIMKLISSTEGLPNKKEMLAAVEKELRKTAAEEKGAPIGHKKKGNSSHQEKELLCKPTKTLKIKIQCDGKHIKDLSEKGEKTNQLQQKVSTQQVLSRNIQTLQLLESLVSGGVEVGDLGERNSIYYDAVEWTDEAGGPLGDHGGREAFTSEGPPEASAEADKAAVTDPSTYAEEPIQVTAEQPQPLLIPSDEFPLSRDLQEVHQEETIFDELLKKFDLSNISYGTTILESLLRKTKNMKGEGANTSRLIQMLQSIGSKSTSLIITMEKNAWLKILSLMEEVLESPDVAGGKDFRMRDNLEYLTAQMNKSKRCLDKIQILNSERLPFKGFSTANIFTNAFSRITDSIKTVKNIFLQGHDDDQPEVLNSRFEMALRGEGLSLQELGKEIQQQRHHLQYLLNCDWGSAQPEIQNIKDKVVKSMKALDKKLSALEGSCRREFSQNLGWETTQPPVGASYLPAKNQK